ncbi:MAG: ATP-binding cassette domain-containing protein [Bacteroidales bacterium]|nr:ATP-binding cassette domain-containing protein [Bacteroidales bacterium]
MIQIENITFGYKEHKVFDNLSMELTDGNIYGLLGLNGAGKSTLLYLISGLLFPKYGTITMDGTDVTKRRPESLSETYIVPEEFELPNMTLKQYVKINSVFYPNFSQEMLEKSLEAFEMGTDLDLGQLSMGQKKKAYLCFALATNTKLLLMDEPTNGLDIPSKSQFRKAVSACMTDNRTIVISTHQVRDIENLLDSIVIVDDSKIILNEHIGTITEKLAFVNVAIGESCPNAIYTQTSATGAAAVVCNTTGKETPMNIELFFNATLAEKEKMKGVFQK